MTVNRQSLMKFFAHLQHLFSLDEGWIYATSSQYHSDVILDVDEDFGNRTVPSGKQNSNVHQFGGCVGDGDALITSQKQILLCTRTADCVPILLYNSEQVAVVHMQDGVELQMKFLPSASQRCLL